MINQRSCLRVDVNHFILIRIIKKESGLLNFFSLPFFTLYSDVNLEKAAMALRKFDFLDLDFLASGSMENLRKMQNLLLYVGYNWWSHAPAQIMGFGHRVKHEWNGRILTDPLQLFTCKGVGRKVRVLLLQDAFHR